LEIHARALKERLAILVRIALSYVYGSLDPDDYHLSVLFSTLSGGCEYFCAFWPQGALRQMWQQLASGTAQ